MSPAEAAAYLRIHRRTLDHWRGRGAGPLYIRVGRRPFYRQADLDGWLNQRVFDSTRAEARIA